MYGQTRRPRTGAISGIHTVHIYEGYQAGIPACQGMGMKHPPVCTAAFNHGSCTVVQCWYGTRCKQPHVAQPSPGARAREDTAQVDLTRELLRGCRPAWRDTTTVLCTAYHGLLTYRALDSTEFVHCCRRREEVIWTSWLKEGATVVSAAVSSAFCYSTRDRV